jgi:hypothetical protein
VVKDFNRAEGDRVLVDPGSTYTVTEDLGGVRVVFSQGNYILLENVHMSTLTGDWISTGWL